MELNKIKEIDMQIIETVSDMNALYNLLVTEPDLQEKIKDLRNSLEDYQDGRADKKEGFDADDDSDNDKRSDSSNIPEGHNSEGGHTNDPML